MRDLVGSAQVVKASVDPVDQSRALHDLAHHQYARIRAQALGPRFYSDGPVERGTNELVLLDIDVCLSFTHGVSSFRCLVRDVAGQRFPSKTYTWEAPQNSILFNSP